MDDEKRSARETDGDSDVEDLDVTREDATEEIKGGGGAFRALRSTSRGCPSVDQGTDEPAE